MLRLLVVLVVCIGAAFGGKGGNNRYPQCRAPKFCYWWVGRNKEVYGPVPVCQTAKQYSYQRAKSLCKDMNLRLCSSNDIWRGMDHNGPQFEPFSDSVMTPVYDVWNEWQQIGDSSCASCPSMGKLYINDEHPESNGPQQGTNSIYKAYKSPFVYCCPKTKFKVFYLGHHVTWDQANEFCSAQIVNRKRPVHPHYLVAHPEVDEKDYYRLCDSVAVCKQRSTPRYFRGTSDQDLWVPVVDRENEWINMNEDSENLCKKYSWIDEFDHTPDWGQDDSCELEERGIVYCCRDVRRVWVYHHHQMGAGTADHDQEEDEQIAAGEEVQEDFSPENDSDGELDAARTIGHVKLEKPNRGKGKREPDRVEAQAIISL